MSSSHWLRVEASPHSTNRWPKSGPARICWTPSSKKTCTKWTPMTWSPWWAANPARCSPTSRAFTRHEACEDGEKCWIIPEKNDDTDRFMVVERERPGMWWYNDMMCIYIYVLYIDIYWWYETNINQAFYGIQFPPLWIVKHPQSDPGWLEG